MGIFKFLLQGEQSTHVQELMKKFEPTLPKVLCIILWWLIFYLFSLYVTSALAFLIDELNVMLIFAQCY